MIKTSIILAQLRKTNKKLRSLPFRAEVSSENAAVQARHRDLIWELELIIQRLKTKQLADLNDELGHYNTQYKAATKQLKASLEGLTKLRTTLENVEQFVGLVSRIFLLFA